MGFRTCQIREFAWKFAIMSANILTKIPFRTICNWFLSLFSAALLLSLSAQHIYALIALIAKFPEKNETKNLERFSWLNNCSETGTCSSFLPIARSGWHTSEPDPTGSLRSGALAPRNFCWNCLGNSLVFVSFHRVKLPCSPFYM